MKAERAAERKTLARLKKKLAAGEDRTILGTLSRLAPLVLVRLFIMLQGRMYRPFGKLVISAGANIQSMICRHCLVHYDCIFVPAERSSLPNGRDYLRKLKRHAIGQFLKNSVPKYVFEKVFF